MGIYQNIKNLLLPSYTLQVNNMATTKSHSILRHLTIAILILAIWTGTTSAGQKCHNGGKKCVATKADGAKFTKNECISHWGSLWCADKEKWTSSSGWTGAVKIVNKDSRRPTGFCRLNNELASWNWFFLSFIVSLYSVTDSTKLSVRESCRLVNVSQIFSTQARFPYISYPLMLNFLIV